LCLTVGDKVYSFLTSEETSGETDAMIQALSTAMRQIFPTVPLTHIIRKVDIQPAQRLQHIRDAELAMRHTTPESRAIGPCGGFSTQYACMCDYHALPYREEVAYDVDNIYLAHGTRELNLKEFDYLDFKDLVAVISGLEYNTWFTSLRASGIKLSHDCMDRCLHVLRKSLSLQCLYLDNIQVKCVDHMDRQSAPFTLHIWLAWRTSTEAMLRVAKDQCPTVMCDARISSDLLGHSTNRIQSSIDRESIRRTLVDKAGTVINRKISLNLSHCGLTSKGVNQICHALTLNKTMDSTLTYLNLSDNSLKDDVTATPQLSSKRKSVNGRKLRPKSVVDTAERGSADDIPDLLPSLPTSAEESLDSVTELPGSSQLQHLVKSRPRRAKTRAPTRATPLLSAQNSIPRLEDEGLDSFFIATPSLGSGGGSVNHTPVLSPLSDDSKADINKEMDDENVKTSTETSKSDGTSSDDNDVTVKRTGKKDTKHDQGKTAKDIENGKDKSDINVKRIAKDIFKKEVSDEGKTKIENAKSSVNKDKEKVDEMKQSSKNPHVTSLSSAPDTPNHTAPSDPQTPSTASSHCFSNTTTGKTTTLPHLKSKVTSADDVPRSRSSDNVGTSAGFGKRANTVDLTDNRRISGAIEKRLAESTEDGRIGNRLLAEPTEGLRRSRTTGEVEIGRDREPFSDSTPTSASSVSKIDGTHHLKRNTKLTGTAVDLIKAKKSAVDSCGSQLVSPISNVSQGLISLNLSHCGLTSKGVNQICHALTLNKTMDSTLTYLNLSDNSLKDDVTNLCNFLAQPNVLKHLDISNTECTLETIFGALLRGCATNLVDLNVSRNVFSTKNSSKPGKQELPLSFKQFFTSALNLKSINIASCKLPLEALKHLLLGLACNESISQVSLDLSYNNLSSHGGAHVLESCIHGVRCLACLDLTETGMDLDLGSVLSAISKNKSLRTLVLNKNLVTLKAKHIGTVINALVDLIQDDDCSIQSLSIADCKLKNEMNNVLSALGTNNSLQVVDITGNFIGDVGARLLAKSLQINSSLHTLHYDRNNITLAGYSELAYGLEHNRTLKVLSYPTHDILPCMKLNAEKCEQVLRKIQTTLSRNMLRGMEESWRTFDIPEWMMILGDSKTRSSTPDVLRSISTDSSRNNSFLSSRSQSDSSPIVISEDEASTKANEINLALSLIEDAEHCKSLMSTLLTDCVQNIIEGNEVHAQFGNMAQDLTSSIHDYMQVVSEDEASTKANEINLALSLIEDAEHCKSLMSTLLTDCVQNIIEGNEVHAQFGNMAQDLTSSIHDYMQRKKTLNG
ncbi:capping protein, Arp2/3 and myosin-I linker protein 3-like, partial [Diaphorina citri]|uniref:Capping protein, Arp2/3 and myosin-I linker protein 3-like n=1 Tax=Diaphorina citri TaxID=121845 RepID=A0A3Q0JED4_DIACI